jgi:hypothetical protein
MPEVYKLIPIIFIVTVVTTLSFSIMFRNKLKIDPTDLSFFFIISAASYAFCMFEIEANPILHRPYGELFKIVYLVYFIAFFTLFLTRRISTSLIKTIAFSALGGITAISTAFGSMIMLTVFYLVTGVFKDS